MSRLTPLILLLGSSLLIPVAASRPGAPQDSLDELEAKLNRQTERLEAAEAELVSLRTQAAATSKASDSLRAALENSREHGFEWAGANPQARTDLLDGLLSFSKTVGQSARSAGKKRPPAGPSPGR